jgi:GNAT superfamily N-acetyltransferase
MNLEVKEEPITALEEYAVIPIAFEVTKVFDVEDGSNGRGDFVLIERTLDVPYVKDYDSINGEAPHQWTERFDLSNWGIFAARVDGRRVGGAAVACNTPGLDILEGREDLAVLWDIRVAPEARGQGAGAALFKAAELWAKARGCRQLKVETQNTNVPACRFYARQNCVLAAVRRSAYPSLPDEIQLFWHKALLHDGTSGSRA